MTTPARFHTSVTERQSFRTCHRRWYLETIERLAPNNRVIWYFIYGDCIHAALDAYYRPKTSRSKKPPRDLADALDAFDEAWAEKDKELQRLYGPVYSQGIEEEWLEHKERAHGMLHHYNIFDKKHPLFDTVVEVGIEERAFVDILDPNGEPIPGRPLLSGRIDLVYEKLKKGAKKSRIGILDHKALSGWADDRALDLDDQLTGYHYIWWRLSGTPADEAYYNILLKDPPKPPKVLVAGNLSVDKSQRTTYELYLQTIQELGLNRADYKEHLAWLAEKGWYQFYRRLGPVKKSIEELLSYERHVYFQMLDMGNAIEHEEARYPSPSQYTCPGCPMTALCQAMEEQGNVEMIRHDMYEVMPPRIEIPEEILNPAWEGV